VASPSCRSLRGGAEAALSLARRGAPLAVVSSASRIFSRCRACAAASRDCCRIARQTSKCHRSGVRLVDVLCDIGTGVFGEMAIGFLRPTEDGARCHGRAGVAHLATNATVFSFYSSIDHPQIMPSLSAACKAIADRVRSLKPSASRVFSAKKESLSSIIRRRPFQTVVFGKSRLLGVDGCRRSYDSPVVDRAGQPRAPGVICESRAARATTAVYVRRIGRVGPA